MRYLIGLVIFILLILFLILKLITSGPSTKTVLPPSLVSYANTATTMRYKIDNPVQAPDNHRDLIIQVGSSSTDVTITKGYDGEVVKSASFPMSESAYATFLLSLERSGGYTLGNTDTKLRDERGYCAIGNRYSYDIVRGDGSLAQHLWSTSCKQKTFRGLPAVVKDLFEKQVPNFEDFTNDLEF